MAEVAAIHIARGVVKLCHGSRNRARHSSADDQCNQLDYREKNEDCQEYVLDSPRDISQRGKKVTVQDRWKSADFYQCSPRPLTGLPIHDRQKRSESDLTIHHAGGRWEGAYSEGRT